MKGKLLVSGTRVLTRGREQTKQTWQAPVSSWVKISMDGSFLEDSGEAGIGVVIQNHLGQVILSSWKYIDVAGSAEQVEALACREGLALAAEWVTLPAIVESDCASDQVPGLSRYSEIAFYVHHFRYAGGSW